MGNYNKIIVKTEKSFETGWKGEKIHPGKSSD